MNSDMENEFESIFSKIFSGGYKKTGKEIHMEAIKLQGAGVRVDWAKVAKEIMEAEN